MVLLFNLGGGEGGQVLVHAAYPPHPPFVVTDGGFLVLLLN
jgi:hypothetical protein